ncbi:glycosyltransferase family 2 protein [Candidatus Woesebacteria bacterium]|nr:glycosyltransferase family 2 protein [Candidatus Woesebacteria bacterium]QQG47195.1 MAG: glycosyltransferase family 2 protein [Candidatus Woesebacteria bacterium]
MNNKNQKTSVSIGIPTYKSPDTIPQVLKSLFKQKTKNVKILEIIIYSDGNNDDTVKNCKKVARNNKKIKIIDAKVRHGMAYGFKYMASLFKGDIFVLFCDDIKIADNYLIEKLTKPLISDKKVGLVGGNTIPLSPKNFFQKAYFSSFNAYHRTAYKLKDGDNKHTCDGAILAFSKNLIKKVKFPKEDKRLGNVDAYMYFATLTNGFKYRFAKNARVYFELASSHSEILSRFSRNNSNKYLLISQFGDIVKKEYKLPNAEHSKSLVIEFLKNPLGSIYIYSMGRYSEYKGKQIAKNFNPTWQVIESTKNI